MTVEPLGIWSLSGKDFLAALRRCEEGESADLVYAEYYVNSDHEWLPDDET